jgi:DNA-binding XRE family transcriptional regulator
MQNALLVVLREINSFTPTIVAQKLDIDPDTYNQLENGTILMDFHQAKGIGRLYKVKADHIYESAWQLDYLLAQDVLIRTFKSRLDDVGAGGSLKEICEKAIMVYDQTNVLLLRVNDMMENWHNGSETMLEHINTSIERSNMITAESNKIIQQNDELYQITQRHIKEVNETFKETYDACQQSVKDVIEINDSLTKENDELKKRL